MIRKPTMLMLALALALAPSAMAQGNETDNETEQGRQAWVDDCPPDMMCAYQAPEEEQELAKENQTGDEPTYDGNCGGEVCAYDAQPGEAMGPDGCIDCMQPPAEEHAAQEADANAVPAAAGALALVGGAIAVALVAGRRQR